MLLLPLAAELVICFGLPPSSVIIDQIGGNVKQLGARELSINQYGSHRMPYSIPLNDNQLHSALHKLYSGSSVRLQDINESTDLNRFVFDQRKSSLDLLLHDYCFGMKWTNETITVFYSTMAYHSIGVGVIEMSNLILVYLNSSRSIVTVNAPLPSNDNAAINSYATSDFLKHLGCFDILPLSLFNFCTSLIIALISGLLTMHVTREKSNGSKDLQLISGTKHSTFWLANFLFDLVFCLIHVLLFVLTILLAKHVRTDTGSDVALVGQEHTIGYFTAVLALSSISWIMSAYCWSHLFKRSDVSACVLFIIVLGIAAFVDVVLSFAHLFIHINDKSIEFESPASLCLYSLRIVMAILFPNVLVKRELFDIKIRNSQYCLDSLNSIMKSKL